MVMRWSSSDFMLATGCHTERGAASVMGRGGNGDLGYPWATMVSRDRVLVVYYFNRANGTRHIAGIYLQLQ